MLTQLDEMTLVRYGSRYRTRYLLEQLRFTLKLAGSENPPLDLPRDYLSEVEAGVARLESARDDREVAEVESKYATLRQNDLIAEAKVWRRKAATRAQRAARLGANVPKELLTIGRVNSVPALLESIGTTVRLFEEHAPELSLAGDVGPLVAEGRRIHDALAEADAEQEFKRLADLPAKVRELFRLKGELYVALKVVNDAGKERHASDPVAAARYNLGILYRYTRRSGQSEEGAKAPATETA